MHICFRSQCIHVQWELTKTTFITRRYIIKLRYSSKAFIAKWTYYQSRCSYHKIDIVSDPRGIVIRPWGVQISKSSIDQFFRRV